MKFLVQRVSSASVTIDNEVVGSIGKGLLVFVGISETDTNVLADRMIKKLIGLRIFDDSEGKTNLSLSDVNGSLLVISQFTLYADCKKGNRPSFIKAGAPDMSSKLYDYILEKCSDALPDHVAHGVFGADMKVALTNDGPFTVMLDSTEMGWDLSHRL